MTGKSAKPNPQTPRKGKGKIVATPSASPSSLPPIIAVEDLLTATDSIWLGGQDCQSRVEWTRQSGKDHLTQVDTEVPEVEAPATGDSTPTSQEDEANNTEITVPPTPSVEKPRPTASLCIVGVISTERCTLHPTGGNFTKALATAKAVCHLERPSGAHADLSGAWEDCIKNAIEIQKMISPHSQDKHRHFCVTENKVTTFRLTHTLFEQLPGDISQEEREDAMSGLASWPVGDGLRGDLDGMVRSGTHYVSPIQAYEKGRERPIHPLEYERKLPGALVKATFALEHTNFRGENGYSTFSAQLERIDILQPPMPKVISPNKRRFQKLEFDSPDGPNTKKTRNIS